MVGESNGTIPRTARKGDWSDWIPADRATLIFVIRNGEILLIRKKRGLGAGKINGPGGRIEPGESALECAIREAEEELRVTPTGVWQRGELSFQFIDGYGIHVVVFSAEGCERVACETEEATPIWTALGQIPYDEMWEDDRIWLPLMIAGESFSGRFVFDGDIMLDAEVDVLSAALR